MPNSVTETKSTNHLGSVAGVSNLANWLVEFDQANKEHYERSQRKEVVLDKSDARDSTFVDVAVEEKSVVENTELLDQKSPQQDVNISLIPPVNDDDVDSDSISDWEDDYDALKVTIEPVLSKET